MKILTSVEQKCFSFRGTPDRLHSLKSLENINTVGTYRAIQLAFTQPSTVSFK